MTELQSIFVPTDFTDASALALDRAVALAVRTKAGLHILHAELLHQSDPARFEHRRKDMLERVEQVRARVANDETPLDVQLVSVRGISAHEVIISAIEDSRPDLVVMTSHGGGLLTASVAEQIVGHAPCPVLVARKDARGRWPEDNGPIAVAVDCSANSYRALQLARSLADDPASIVLIHVVASPDRPPLYADALPLPFETDPQLQGRLQGMVTQWASGHVGDIVVTQGEVERSILEEADRRAAVLVVIGTAGQQDLPTRWLGGTAQRLTRRSKAPILTVP
jgi:nucleotide-binding universal stress UspA family protein